MSANYGKNEMTRAIYAAAFVRKLDEHRLRAGSRERRATAQLAHEFAITAVEAFVDVTESKT